MNRKYILSIVVVFLFFLFLAGNSALAWTIDSITYPYRNNITNNAIIQFPISVNDTYGVCRDIIWSNASTADTSGVYKTATGCTGASVISDDGTNQACWENESNIDDGNCRAEIWNSASAFAVYHMTGTGKDSTQYANNLTLTGSPAVVTGVFGNALNFSNPTSGQINQYASSEGDLPIKPLDNFTLVAWFKASKDSNKMMIIAEKTWDSSYSPSFGVRRYPSSADKKISCIFGTNDAVSNNGTTANVWYMVACVNNGTTGITYINGKYDVSQLADLSNYGIDYTNDSFHIGGNPNTCPNIYYCNPFDGVIDEVRVYDRVLSETELTDMYNNGINSLTSLQAEESPPSAPLNISILFPPNGNINNTNTMIFGFNASNADTITLWGNFSGTWSANETNSTFDTIIATIPDGTYSWGFEAQNSTDSLFTENRTLKIDSVAPSITIQSPSNATYTTTNIWFNMTAGSNADTCIIDYGLGNITMTNSFGNYNYNDASVSQGVHTATFYCNNSVGMWNSNAITFTIDSIPPNIIILSPTNPTYYNTATIWFNITLDKNGNTCFVNYSSGNIPMTNSSGNWHYSTTLSNGAYTPRFWCNDTAGNSNTTTGSTFNVISPPKQPLIDPSSITGQLVFTLGFGIMGLFAVLTLLGFGYIETTGKPDPETIAKIMIGVVIIILAIVAVWTGIVTPP